MPRHYGATIFMPFPVAGRPWVVFGLTRAAPAYPEVVFNAFCYIPQGTFVTPVHAFNLAQDWANTPAHVNFQQLTPIFAGLDVGPIYLWDGAVMHTFPVYHGPGGLYPLELTGKAIGVSFTKFFQGSRIIHKIVGRAFISPIPKVYLAGGDKLHGFAITDLKTLMQSAYLDTFTSEGNTWQPAIFTNAQQIARPIQRMRMMERVTMLRRRLRKAPWTGTLHIPPPFPTSTG